MAQQREQQAKQHHNIDQMLICSSINIAQGAMPRYDLLADDSAEFMYFAVRRATSLARRGVK
jgi:hypothetical protein